MKYVFLLAIAILFYNCKAQNSTRVKLYYVDFDIMTPIDVGCNNFEEMFNTQVRKCLIVDKKDVNFITHSLDDLKIDTSNYIPDVRGKLIILNSSRSKMYCLSKFGIVSENKTYFMPSNLLKILYKYMKSTQRKIK